MGKIYTALGLMSGTSMDGVDASIIQTDCGSNFEIIIDKYFKYDDNLFSNLTSLRAKINGQKDLKLFSNEIKLLEEKITLFHAEVVKKITSETNVEIDFIGFHGQTIYHNSNNKISKQIGDGKILSKLTKKTVVYDFRQNDIKNGGQGAPLTPVFHSMLEYKFKLAPLIFLNIGGIVNATAFWETGHFIAATDIGPGMCLIDRWIRSNTKNKYDENGSIASSGEIRTNLNFALDEFYYNEKKDLKKNYIKSFDINDFDISFVKELSIEDGAATLTEYTAQIIIHYFFYINEITKKNKYDPILVLSGGGRKNSYLVERIKKGLLDTNNNIVKLIDDYGIDGDFVESQAFAYLSVCSHLKLPISFPETTGCTKPSTGGVIIKNF